MIKGKVALRPKNEAPRQTGRTVERGTANYFSNDIALNTQLALQMQRLRLLGIIGERARLLAPLAWGDVA